MSPRPDASAAVIGRPVSSSSTATGRGSRRGSRSTPPESGIMPSPVSGRRNSACSAATTRSAARTSSKPPPAAIPLTAAMTGLVRPCNSVSPAKPPGPWSASTASPAAAARRSQPAQKNRPPAAVTIPTRRSGSFSRRANASYSAWLVATSTALAGGRSSVISSTPPDASARTGAGLPAISGAPFAEHRARDDVPLDLAGPVPYPLDPRVAPEPLHREVAHEAHAAEDLYRLVGDPAEHLRGVELGHRGVGIAHPALVEPPGGAKGEQLGGFDLGRHVGEAETDALEPPDRLPELLAGCRPPGAQLQHPPGPPDAGCRHGEPARPEPLAQQVKPSSLGAEQCGAGDPAVGERQLAMVVATMGYRRCAAADRESRGAVVDEESRYRRALAPRSFLGAGHGEQHHEVGDIGIADEVLGAVDDPVAASPPGPGLHRTDIRAGSGLRHRQAVVALTADRRQEIGLHLAVLAGPQDVTGPGNQRLQRPRRPPELALGQGHSHGIEATAAQLGREVRGVKAGRERLAADLSRQLIRHRVEPFDQILVWFQLAADKVADRGNHGTLFLVKPKIHGLSLPPFLAAVDRLARRQPAGRRMPITCPTAAGRGSTACALQISCSRACRSSGIGTTRPLGMSTCTSNCSAVATSSRVTSLCTVWIRCRLFGPTSSSCNGTTSRSPTAASRR